MASNNKILLCYVRVQAELVILLKQTTWFDVKREAFHGGLTRNNMQLHIGAATPRFFKKRK